MPSSGAGGFNPAMRHHRRRLKERIDELRKLVILDSSKLSKLLDELWVLEAVMEAENDLKRDN
jgi:hypothetical protein